MIFKVFCLGKYGTKAAKCLRACLLGPLPEDLLSRTKRVKLISAVSLFEYNLMNSNGCEESTSVLRNTI